MHHCLGFRKCHLPSLPSKHTHKPPPIYPSLQPPPPAHIPTSSGKGEQVPELLVPVKVSSDSSSSLTCNDEHLSLPTHKLVIIHFALAISLFLATTDTHIVSTSLPTIVAELPGQPSLYSWVGVSYTLTQTAFQPLYGKLADIIGRKPVLHSCIAVFLFGSALCGAAQSMIWLVLARGLAGVGAGGIVAMVWVIMGEIVPARDRAKWSEALSSTWAASALAGPLLGGVFSERISWRWGFYINIPLCGASTILLLCFLTHPLPGPEHDRKWVDVIRRFDIIGLFLLMSGTTSLLLGFTAASLGGWDQAKTIGPLSTGGSLLLFAGYYETRTSQEPLIPPRIFQTRTTVVILIASFFQTFAFTAGTFYLALYYQAVCGADALTAGFMMLPYSLGSALFSVAGSRYIQYTEKYKHVVLSGLGLAALGFGLMISLDHRSSRLLQELFPLVAGMGMGLLFRSPFTALEAAMPSRDRASSTGNFFLVRFIGTCTGLSIAGAIFESRVHKTLPKHIMIDAVSFDWRTLVHIQPQEVREHVLLSVSSALSMIWVVCTPCLAVSFLLCFLIRNYPISNSVVIQAQAKIVPSDFSVPAGQHALAIKPPYPTMSNGSQATTLHRGALGANEDRCVSSTTSAMEKVV